jgi:AcrR family transcriptional regulator
MAAPVPPAVPTRRGDRPRRLSRGERRNHLLDVAADLIVDGGFEAVTMEGVAARAGVSKGLGYAYFDNRDELLAALFDRELGGLDHAVTEAVWAARRAHATFSEQLRASFDASLDIVAERGRLIGALLAGSRGGGPLEHRRVARQRNVEVFYVEMITAEFGIDERTALAAVGILLGGFNGAIDLWSRQHAGRRRLTETYLGLATGGLAYLRDQRAQDWGR